MTFPAASFLVLLVLALLTYGKANEEASTSSLRGVLKRPPPQQADVQKLRCNEIPGRPGYCSAGTYCYKMSSTRYTCRKCTSGKC